MLRQKILFFFILPALVLGNIENVLKTAADYGIPFSGNLKKELKKSYEEKQTVLILKSTTEKHDCFNRIYLDPIDEFNNRRLSKQIYCVKNKEHLDNSISNDSRICGWTFYPTGRPKEYGSVVLTERDEKPDVNNCFNQTLKYVVDEKSDDLMEEILILCITTDGYNDNSDYIVDLKSKYKQHFYVCGNIYNIITE